MFRSSIPVSIFLCLFCSTFLLSCDALKSSDDEGGGFDQAEIAEFFTDNQDAPFVMMDAMSRLFLVLNGTQAQGITLTPRTTKGALTYDAVIGLDFDYDGTYETNVNGNITFPGTEPNLDNGAVAQITGITGSSVNGTATFDVTGAGFGGAFLDGTGSFQGPSGPPVDVDMAATVSVFQSSINGSADVTAGDFEATVFFEPAQFAPFQIRVVNDDFDFVVGADLLGKSK